jgi:hypothetical protein
VAGLARPSDVTADLPAPFAKFLKARLTGSTVGQQPLELGDLPPDVIDQRRRRVHFPFVRSDSLFREHLQRTPAIIEFALTPLTKLVTDHLIALHPSPFISQTGAARLQRSAAFDRRRLN